MDDLISRKELCEYALNQKDKSITPNDIMRFPSAEPFDVRTAYYKGLNDGIKQCTERLKRSIDEMRRQND